MTDATNSMTKLHEDDAASLARQIAVSCWCDTETSGIEMDTRLAEAFAKRLLLWISTGEQYAINADFYRNIVIEIGEMFGDTAKTSDDGSLQGDILALKVPELVSEVLEELKQRRLQEDAALYHLGG